MTLIMIVCLRNFPIPQSPLEKIYSTPHSLSPLMVCSECSLRLKCPPPPRQIVCIFQALSLSPLAGETSRIPLAGTQLHCESTETARLVMALLNSSQSDRPGLRSAQPQAHLSVALSSSIKKKKNADNKVNTYIL